MKIRDLLTGIPEGVYRVVLAGVQEGNSQAGRPMYTLDWEIVDGLYTGQSIRDWLVLTSEGLRRWAQLYVATGGSPDEEVTTVAELAQQCLKRLKGGAMVWVEVEHRAGNDGVPRPRVRTYHDPKHGEVLAAQYRRREEQVPF